MMSEGAYTNKQTNHSGRERIAAAVTALAIVLFMFLSVLFIAHEADHDCSGEGCPICELIQMVENNIRQIGSGAALTVAVSSLAYLAAAVLTHGGLVVANTSPVLRKTRLNN